MLRRESRRIAKEEKKEAKDRKFVQEVEAEAIERSKEVERERAEAFAKSSDMDTQREKDERSKRIARVKREKEGKKEETPKDVKYTHEEIKDCVDRTYRNNFAEYLKSITPKDASTSYNIPNSKNESNNKEDRDKAFRDVFLEEFSELFDDVDEVRTYLQNHISDSPYHWLGNKAVTAKIKTMANAKYNESGYGKAKKVIDEMPAEQVKEYLKKMIEDNFVVGLEIIKKQK